MMKPTASLIRSLTSTLVVASLASTASGQVLNPANGHYYQFVASSVDWDAARAAAAATVFQSAAGHLVTITSQAEQDFLALFSLPSSVWIGAFQDSSHPNYSEPSGGWVWITGEPFVYTHWASGEPNDSPPNEDALEMFNGSTVWNDISRQFIGFGYIIEWDAIGSSYCTANVNSTGVTGTVLASGSVVVASNNFILTAERLPPSSFGYFLVSRSPGLVLNPGGSAGNLCLAGAIGRFLQQVQSSGPAGRISISVDLTAIPTPSGTVPVLAGDRFYFQAWHRDALSGVPTSNFTHGLSVQFF